MIDDLTGDVNESQENEKSGMQREEPVLEKSVEQFVSLWQKKIRAAKIYFKDDFKRMREDMKIARQGADDDWINSNSYVVPIINRYLNQSVASLYAKNPTAQAERRKTMDFQVWDGKLETAQLAYQNAQMGDPMAAMTVQDIEEGKKYRDMIDRIGRTLEILFDYYSNEQKPRLKPLMKSMVRRAKTCGVAYLMLGFQRQYAELSPDESARLEDARNKMGEMQRRMMDFIDGEIDPSMEHELYELEKLIADLENTKNSILREGPLFMFPRATEIIVDPRCTNLMGFLGAGWIAREFHKTPAEIKKIYKVDIGSKFTAYSDNGADKMAKYHYDSDDSEIRGDNEEMGLVCIWEVYNKELGQTFTICDGYKDFLKPCGEPDYWMEGFWPVFAITFNASESEEHLYPLSDVHALKHVQAEYNRSREYRRLHREANKPKYMTIKGRLSDEDKELLESHPPHAVIELDGMGTNESVRNMLQRFEPVPMDPALYETNSEMEDVLRTVGAQEANIGGTGGGTATESSIAEGSRMTSLASNVDDLDEFLSDFVTATGQLMLKELSKETVMEIAGKGAVWPEMDVDQIAKQTLLKVRAGSSGRPNKAADLANMERGMPYIVQLPGINPLPFGKRYLDLLDIDMEDAIVEGLPSIQAQNAQFARSLGSPQGGTNDPNMQGAAGQQNAQSTQTNEPGAQPAYPTA